MEGFGVTQDNPLPESLANVGEFRVRNEAARLKKEKVFTCGGERFTWKTPPGKVFSFCNAPALMPN